jgi:hypothetical protein
VSSGPPDPFDPPNKDRTVTYRLVFPDVGDPRPLSYFMLENLLAARADSRFPTNSRGPDEAVNVYLAALLTRLVADPPPAEVVAGATALLTPLDKCALTRRARADHYRHNADHRLIALGLFGRGDLLRRRDVPLGLTVDEARARDEQIGAEAYRLAAHLLDGRSTTAAVLAPILYRLAENFTDYVHVLTILAWRRFDLGAHLSEDDLDDLLTVTPATAPAAMDGLLDELSVYLAEGSAAAREAVIRRAQALGIDPDCVFASLSEDS